MFHTYADLVNHCYSAGELTSSRLGRTRELIGTTLNVPAGYMPRRPGIRRELGYMEGLQFIAEVFSVHAIKRVAPNVNTSLFTQQSAYGPRTTGQLSEVISELREVPDSRRAVILFPNDQDELTDLPCTTSIQFILRDNALHSVVSTRSWDLWFGAPYDIIQFGMVNQHVANSLGVSPGWLHITAGSAHLYHRHLANCPIANGRPRSFRLRGSDVAAAHAWVVNEAWLDGPPPMVDELWRRPSYAGGVPFQFTAIRGR